MKPLSKEEISEVRALVNEFFELKHHEHKYVIPVEWYEKWNHGGGNSIQGMYVTKLRCECGEEIDR